MRRLIKISGGKMHFQTNLISKSSMIIAFCTNTKNTIICSRLFVHIKQCLDVQCFYVLACLAALHSDLTRVTYNQS